MIRFILASGNNSSHVRMYVKDFVWCHHGRDDCTPSFFVCVPLHMVVQTVVEPVNFVVNFA